MASAQIVQILSLVLAIASFSWAVFVTLRRGDILRHAIKVTLGLTAISRDHVGDGETKTRRLDRSTLIFAAPLRQDETGFFAIPLCIRNMTPNSLRKVNVLLDYPEQHLIRELPLLSKFHFDDDRRVTATANNKRVIQSFGRMAHVVHEFDLLRPGEGVVLHELIAWRVPAAPRTSETSANIPSLDTRLARAGVAGYFPLHVFISAENALPTACRYNILWMNEDMEAQSETETDEFVRRLSEAFWMRLPKSGIYFVGAWPLRRSIFKWEAAEVLHLNLTSARYQGRRYRITEQEPRSFGLARLLMPAWNYHEDPRPNVEALRSSVLSTFESVIHKLQWRKR
jgi:hypothetical protein